MEQAIVSAFAGYGWALALYAVTWRMALKKQAADVDPLFASASFRPRLRKLSLQVVPPRTAPLAALLAYNFWDNHRSVVAGTAALTIAWALSAVRAVRPSGL